MIDTKTKILRKSLELFLRKNYKEVTMRDIVNAVGLTKGAFYHYYRSKEEIFEECVRYFYSHLIITDYGSFPNNSLKAFYMTYLDRLAHPPEGIDEQEDDNVLIFIMEAAKKIPVFREIHTGQRKKETDAWTSAVQRAKDKGEIKTDIPSGNIAGMFLNLSDGIALNRMIMQKKDEESDSYLKRDWDDLYKLLSGK